MCEDDGFGRGVLTRCDLPRLFIYGRSAFILGDQERQGGISPHVSPFMEVADAGNLLSSSGFSLCTGTNECFAA